jgi:hypothetical protein
MTAEQFWKHLKRGRGCWEWQGRRMTQTACPYGVVWFEGKHQLAHRVAWYLAHGEWPKACVLHKCDNPPCCRPSHLFAGTRDENNKDRMRKNRGHRPVGTLNPRAALSPTLIAALRRWRAAGVPYVVMARTLGVRPDTVSHAVRGRTWRGAA